MTEDLCSIGACSMVECSASKLIEAGIDLSMAVLIALISQRVLH